MSLGDPSLCTERKCDRMPRIRWNQPCAARSSRTGNPCRAWSIRGGTVCAVHGGRAPVVMQEAAVRYAEVVLGRVFSRVRAKHLAELEAFHVDRIVTTARLMGIPIEEVDSAWIIWCHSQHGVPPLEHEAPRIGDIKADRRIIRALANGPRANPRTGQRREPANT